MLELHPWHQVTTVLHFCPVKSLDTQHNREGSVSKLYNGKYKALDVSLIHLCVVSTIKASSLSSRHPQANISQLTGTGGLLDCFIDP